MVRHKDFDAARAEQVGEPLTFTLGGKEFTVPAEIPIGPILELADLTEADDAGAYKAFGRFLVGIVVPDQRDEFREVLNGVGMATLLELVQWVIQEATGRPLERASSSPAPPSSNGEPLRHVSLAPMVEETRSA